MFIEENWFEIPSVEWSPSCLCRRALAGRDWVTHICFIIYTHVGSLSIRHEGTYFNEILFEILFWIFLFFTKKMHLKTSSVKWQLFCLGSYMLSRYNITWNILIILCSLWALANLSWQVFIDKWYRGSIITFVWDMYFMSYYKWCLHYQLPICVLFVYIFSAPSENVWTTVEKQRSHHQSIKNPSGCFDTTVTPLAHTWVTATWLRQSICIP